MTNINAPIEVFLADYKVRMMSSYTELHAKYAALNSEVCELWNSGKKEESRELQKQLHMLQQVHGSSNMYVVRFKMHELEKIIDKDLEKRKIAFIKRITDKVGEISTADLKLGQDGSINGTVEGSQGKATVTSIIAGGYNIQKAHYRVLVKAA